MITDMELWWKPRPGALAHRRDAHGQAVCGNQPRAGLTVRAVGSDSRCRTCTVIGAPRPVPREPVIVDFPRRQWADDDAHTRAVRAELLVFVLRYAGNGARDTATALLIDHVDRGDGRCAAVVCGGADGGHGSTVHPCNLARLAEAAVAPCEPVTGPMPVIPAQRSAPPVVGGRYAETRAAS